MFFKVLTAIVTADAFDRHMREQQHRAWMADEARRQAAALAPTATPSPGRTAVDASAWTAPERPT